MSILSVDQKLLATILIQNLSITQMSRTKGAQDAGGGFRSEYLLDGASKKSVWNQISTSRGLSEWFAPEVELYGVSVHVFWDRNGDDRKASIVEAKEGDKIKWVWDDDPESYLSMEIVTTELSHTISLLVDDHDLALDQKTLMALWEAHIEKLKTSLGIY